MSWKKKFLVALLMLTVLLAAALGMAWHMRHYVLVGLDFYPKDARQLDLRDQEISVRHYNKLCRMLPDCEVHWNVPFQGKPINSDTKELTVTTLSEEDLRLLEYFDLLEKVTAKDCTDYENLLKLWETRPDLQVEYTVALGTENHSVKAEQVTLDSVTPEEIPLLEYLPKLKRVVCSGGAVENITQLEEYCRDQKLEFLLSLGGEAFAPNSKEITAASVTDDQLVLLQFLPNLERLYIRQPKASARKLLELQKAYPDTDIGWELDVFGQTLTSSLEEIDLSSAEVTDLEALEQALAYFPKAKLVFLGECGLDNELLAAHREQARDRYKLVWTVAFGDKMKSRTDATTFMPVREHIYYFNDEEAYNLRYCEDMVCIDIGHMSIHNIDFVEFMPDLEYLILAHTQLQYIEPISSCKKLKFLELDWCPLRDLTPLKGCTALEDLNLGNTFADVTPVGEMTWLKNLWMIDCSSRARYEMSQALPDTNIMLYGAATVANGWRNLDNYYKMRDLLGMHYMSW